MPAPRLIVLSPGPGRPEDAGCCQELVLLARGRVPVFGVCLGLQSIVQALGGKVGPAGEVVHGKSVRIEHEGSGIFEGLPSPLQVGRYHSLVATEVPEDLDVVGRYGELVMAVAHRRDPHYGRAVPPGVDPHAQGWAAARRCDRLGGRLARCGGGAMKGTLETLCGGGDLTREQSSEVFGRVMAGELSEIEISALVVALKTKGETPEEIAGAAQAMRQAATSFDTADLDVADTCGTGGDASGTVNISTAVALLVAEAGLAIVKHGNRSVSSRCGSADVLQQCGVNIQASPEVSGRCLKEQRICFLFAPQYHAGVRHAMPVRRALGMRTIFNVLGSTGQPGQPTLADRGRLRAISVRTHGPHAGNTWVRVGAGGSRIGARRNRAAWPDPCRAARRR